MADAGTFMFDPQGNMTIEEIRVLYEQISLSYPDAAAIYFNLEKVERIDMTGFQMIAVTSSQCKADGKWFKLDPVSENVKRYFGFFNIPIDHFDIG